MPSALRKWRGGSVRADMACRVASTLALCLLVTLPIALSQADLPHINDCGLCMKCVVDSQPEGLPVRHEDVIPANFQPQDVHAKQIKPLCQECRGCTTSLQVLVSSGEKVLWNRTFKDEAGASPNWLFVAPTNRTESGRAIVKADGEVKLCAAVDHAAVQMLRADVIFARLTMDSSKSHASVLPSARFQGVGHTVSCIPVGKHSAAKLATCHADLYSNFVKLLLAIEQITEDCELTDVVPKVWVEPISAIIPGIGFHIRWLGLWMEQAEGVSLENLVRLGRPMMHPNEFLQIMHDRVNHTQVVHAAIFDLLTSQCDRHAQNIFIGEEGGIKLIDNERALYEGGTCALDSIFLPTTKKFTINVMENAWVNKFRNWGTKEPKCWANPPLLLDYRCHVAGGRMEKQWPQGVARCLQKLKGMSTKQIFDEYSFPSMNTAAALKNRSEAMHDHGFEFALTHGLPLNPNPWRYKFAPPCCEIIHTDTYRCKHEWQPDTAIPFGDVNSGGPWKQERPDPGSYEGGSVF